MGSTWGWVVVLLGPLLGFLSALVLFEITEWRKVRLAQRALREALVAELQHAEVVLSTVVGKYAHLAQTSDEVRDTASAIRWFFSVGRKRAKETGVTLVEVPEDTIAQLQTLEDAKVIQLFAQARPERVETVGVTVILPVVASALAGRTSGFKAGEIRALSTVRWQAHLLEQDAGWMAEFLRLTYTVTDQTNHAIVSQNHDRRTRSYAHRAGVLLRCVRVALRKLGAGG